MRNDVGGTNNNNPKFKPLVNTSQISLKIELDLLRPNHKNRMK